MLLFYEMADSYALVSKVGSISRLSPSDSRKYEYIANSAVLNCLTWKPAPFNYDEIAILASILPKIMTFY